MPYQINTPLWIVITDQTKQLSIKIQWQNGSKSVDIIENDKL